MGALTPARPTASRAGAVTPITGRAATAPGLPYRHTIISTRTDRSDRWVTSGCLWTSTLNEAARCRASWRATGGVSWHEATTGIPQVSLQPAGGYTLTLFDV